jgi:hypothetical protein
VSAPLVPSHDHDVHLVLWDFGEHGTAYVETDPANADRNAVIRALLAGEYERPISVKAVQGPHEEKPRLGGAPGFIQERTDNSIV